MKSIDGVEKITTDAIKRTEESSAKACNELEICVQQIKL